MTKQDTNLLYSGGSGGFLLFHLLLLSNRYTAAFTDTNDLDFIINSQWNISDPDKWKLTEIIPNNRLTSQLDTNLNKLYLYCNPDLTRYNTYCKFNVCLYTDYTSQTKLAFYKKAHWYLNRLVASDQKFSAYRTLLKTWRNHYNAVKDPSWPECTSFRKINTLPDHIQKEVLDNPHVEYFFNFKYTEPVVEFQNQLVYRDIAPFLNTADVTIKLQDLVNSNGTILADLLDISVNQKQQQLISTWKSLHPPELLADIGIEL